MKIEDKYIKIKYRWWSEPETKHCRPDNPDIVLEGYFVDIWQKHAEVLIIDSDGNFMTIDYWLLINAVN